MWEQYFTHIYKLFLFFNGMKVLGIDEAGRGPVIGPLIIAGVMIEDGEEDKINGVKDSKLLSHKKRIELDKKIRENAEFIIIEVHRAGERHVFSLHPLMRACYQEAGP